MAKAIWNGKVIAESDTTETVEGIRIFRGQSQARVFSPQQHHLDLSVEGQARYLNLLIDGQDNPDAAWYYPDPNRRRGRSRVLWPSGGVWKWRSKPSPNPV